MQSVKTHVKRSLWAHNKGRRERVWRPMVLGALETSEKISGCDGAIVKCEQFLLECYL
jgi:hypothetical protein